MLFGFGLVATAVMLFVLTVAFVFAHLREKMKVDVQEMLYWLQQERRQKAVQSSILGHATLEFTKPA